MDFEPRSIVNGSLLRSNIGKHVSVFIKVTNVEGNGRVIKGKTTDNIDIRVMLSDPLNAPVNDWIEVIGIPSANEVIKCQEIIVFDKNEKDEEFDTNSHNMLVQFLAECQKDYYKIE